MAPLPSPGNRYDSNLFVNTQIVVPKNICEGTEPLPLLAGAPIKYAHKIK